MGCDIHTRVEFQNREGNWICGDFFRINPYYKASDPYEIDPMMVVEVGGDRNYRLFAVLANVRNYDDIPYIDNPRDIPDDACARTRRDYLFWQEDAHSASYFTLKELIEWNETAEPVEGYDGEMYKPLDSLIEELIKRGEDLGLWYSENKARESGDKLRFVFWFDN